MQEHNGGFLELIAELEHLIEIQGVASQERSTVDIEDFDPLEMDQFNELHTCSHRLLEVATDARVISDGVNGQLSELKDLLVVQERLQQDNYELVLQTRMIPVQSVVPRLHRAIRQASRVTNKNIKLHIIGSETLIDREILNDLVDPLMHLIRNAVDHGIESNERRAIIGKPETGNITLEFARHGNRIIVICQDDGAGLDLVKIRATAEKKNLITTDQALSDFDLQRLILSPGFTTRESATQVSGRGIGMDAVNLQVLKMKGEVIIDSQFGNGCRVELALPATLSSVRALLVSSGDQTFAISNRSLEQILYPGAGKLQQIGNNLAYQQDDKLYSAERFGNLISHSDVDTENSEGSLSALLFKTETSEIKAILVEQVVDSRELVVKNMGQYIPEIPGIAGATILGDGSVTPVLDIPDLLRASTGQVVVQNQHRSDLANKDKNLPNALVIDDSLSARRSAAQLLGDMGLSVTTAIDGVDAIDKLEEKIPDVVLVDLEMPRMNGLEFTSHLRNRADTKELPVIMITSRATAKHRQLAENTGVNVYLNKPFSEDELMGHVTKSVGDA
jgi:chemosensory pili system protein ChpA (sensor histidine kinase/response regulator)